MNYTDSQLKQALAKMLPEKILWNDHELVWIDKKTGFWSHVAGMVLDTELLHLCWMIEEMLDYDKRIALSTIIANHIEFPNGELFSRYEVSVILHATWQQRVIALAKVKGVEIV